MSAMHSAPAAAQPSLRALARSLQVSHASLSQAIREGRLFEGVALDQHDRAVVVDAAAAAAQWARVHVRTLRMPTPREPPRPAQATDPLDAAVYDRCMDRWITPRELLAESAVSSLLACALAALALDAGDVDAIRKMTAAQLRSVAGLHGAGEATIAEAEHELDRTLQMLTASDE